MSVFTPISELIKQRNEAETEIERLQSRNAQLLAACGVAHDAIERDNQEDLDTAFGVLVEAIGGVSDE